jgi:hypothetical protein
VKKRCPGRDERLVLHFVLLGALEATVSRSLPSLTKLHCTSTPQQGAADRDVAGVAGLRDSHGHTREDLPRSRGERRVWPGTARQGDVGVACVPRRDATSLSRRHESEGRAPQRTAASLPLPPPGIALIRAHDPAI